MTDLLLVKKVFTYLCHLQWLSNETSWLKTVSQHQDENEVQINKSLSLKYLIKRAWVFDLGPTQIWTKVMLARA